MSQRWCDLPFGRGARSASAPTWRRDEGVREIPRRYVRPPEPWELEAEPYPGATALQDLPLATGDAGTSALVLARFVVLRLAVRAAAGRTELIDRLAAIEYLAGPITARAAERDALGRVVRLTTAPLSPGLAVALIDAGDVARRRRHDGAAFGFLRAAYQIALDRCWLAEAARAAELIARLADEFGGYWSPRRWRRRATALARRAAAS